MSVEEIAAEAGADGRAVPAAGEEVQAEIEFFGPFGLQAARFEPLDRHGLDGAVVGAIGDDGPAVEFVAVGVAARAALDSLDLVRGRGGVGCVRGIGWEGG